jgi:hypothetical protein
MTNMEAAIVFPLLPGKSLALARFMTELTGDHRSAHDLSHSMVARESWFLQATPTGDLVIVYLEALDPMEVFAELAVSTGTFEVWFRAQVLELTGIDLALLPPFCPPTRILHRIRESATDVKPDLSSPQEPPIGNAAGAEPAHSVLSQGQTILSSSISSTKGE